MTRVGAPVNNPLASEEIVSVALGSNLGDRESYLRAGLQGLTSTPETSLIRFSRIYETAPMGPEGQGPYLNAVVQLVTDLSPEKFLLRLMEIENEQGRDRDGERWGARTLDLDLLLFGDRCIEDEILTVPHPGLAKRMFVLAPLCDVAAEGRHPESGSTFSQLARQLGDDASVCVWRDEQMNWVEWLALKV